MATEEPSAGARGDLGQAWGNPSAHRQVDSSSVMKREKHASLYTLWLKGGGCRACWGKVGAERALWVREQRDAMVVVRGAGLGDD